MMLSSNELAAELDRLDVPYVRGCGNCEPAEPASLFASLADSPEARLRAAIIPLLLWRPRLAEAVPAAIELLAPRARTVLQCHYTAAVVLQTRYCLRLVALDAEDIRLPDYFSKELGLDLSPQNEDLLIAVARRQAETRAQGNPSTGPEPISMQPARS